MTIPMMLSSPTGYGIAVAADVTTVFIEVEQVVRTFKRQICIAHQLLP
jgi:hypothetical protein